MKISKRVRAIIGLVSIVFVVVFGILWTTVLRQEVTSTQVLVLKNAVQRGDSIEANNIALKSISRTDIVPGALQTTSDAQSLMKLEARQYIPAGTQLVKEYFDTPDLVLNDNQYIFVVPSDWILAVPDTLRRKDRVIFYAVSEDNVNNYIGTYATATAAEPSAQPTSIIIETNTPAPTKIGKNSVSATATISPSPTPSPTEDVAAEPTSTISASEDLIQKILSKGEKYEIKTVVAYAKDKSNHEIIDSSTEAEAKMERLDGSGSIARIEIIATKEQVDILQAAVLQGYKFVILYQ